MNEIVSLDQVVSEIKFFENQAVVSFWEIGKRLTKAKDQVPHGEWGKWIDDNLGYSQSTANKLMKVFSEFPNSESITNLTFTQALALTDIKDKEERKEFIEENPVDEMTVKDLKEKIKNYKEQAKKIEVDLEEQKDINDLLVRELESEREKETEVIEREVIKEVVPSDYEELKRQLKELQVTNSDLKNKLVIESNKKKLAIGELEEEQQKEKLMKEINSFAWTINGFIKEVGGLIYLTDYVNEVPKSSRDLFTSSAKTLLDWANQLNYNLENKEDIY